jgi:hypothetical protein
MSMSRQMAQEVLEALQDNLAANQELLAGKARVSAGSEYALAVTSSPSVALTPPLGATEADITVRDATVVFTLSGVPPTSTKGTPAYEDDVITLGSRDELEKFLAIAVSTSATLDVEYFRYA